MTPALLLSLALGQTPSLEYTMPLEEAQRTVESYVFTTFEPSEKPLYLGVDEANLRAAPAPDAAVVTTLTLGSPVRVLKRNEGRAKVGEYVNAWYQVEFVDTKSTKDAKDDQRFTGWLFGNTLTPFRFEGDFDGDGELEVATVVMSADFKIRVRVLEPNVKPPRRVSSVDADTASGGYLGVEGGPAVAKPVSAKTVGMPLLQVDSTPEACGDYRTTYVSYTVPGKKKGVLGKARIAIELTGLADPPNMSEFKVSFQPGAQRLSVVRTTTEEVDEDGKELKKTTRELYQYQDGVYVEVKPASGAALSEVKP